MRAHQPVGNDPSLCRSGRLNPSCCRRQPLSRYSINSKEDPRYVGQAFDSLGKHGCEHTYSQIKAQNSHSTPIIF